jgi:hypothetical protein
MIVRSYRESDLGAILDLHRRQNLGYELPELGKMAASCIIEEGGNITHAVFLRGIVEGFWLFDPAREWKRQTLGRLLVLHKEVERIAAKDNIEEIDVWIPPQVLDKKMDLTMLKLGWEKPLWTCYRHAVTPLPVEVQHHR